MSPAPTIVDASVLVAAAVDTGLEGRWAERVVASSPLAAPELVLAESANILRRLEAARRLDPTQAWSAHDDLLALDLLLYPYEPLARRIWELRTHLTTYDAWYVALAESLDSPLATLDLRLTRAPGPRCDFRLPE